MGEFMSYHLLNLAHARGDSTLNGVVGGLKLSPGVFCPSSLNPPACVELGSRFEKSGTRYATTQIIAQLHLTTNTPCG
jgi:hypothetical protein